MTTGPLIVFLLAEERRKKDAAAALALQQANETHSSAIGSETLTSAQEREGSAHNNAKDKSDDNENEITSQHSETA